MKMRRIVNWCIGTTLVVAGTAALAQSPGLQTIRVVAIPGRPLPVVVAQMHGSFARAGIKVEVEVPPSSDALRGALADGKADIAHAAVDNAVAMVESAGADVKIVMGGEGSLNELIAQPDIRSVSELRGKALLVDAPNTAFALQLKKILLASGLQSGRDYELKPLGATPLRLKAMQENKEYAASILGPPTSIVAKHSGFLSLGTTEKLTGPYQSLGAFVQRRWAQDHASLLVAYLAAYIEAQRWLLDPANKQQVIDLLEKEAKIPASFAEESYALSMHSREGLKKDARFDLDGFKNVLKLRAEIEGQWGGRPPAPDRYYDPTYYLAALSKLGTK